MAWRSVGISTIEIRTPDYITEPIRQQYIATSLEELLPEINFPLEENARKIAEKIQFINSELQQELQGQKSIVVDAKTIAEATDAFIDLYTQIIDGGTRKFLDEKIEKLAKKGKTENEIIEELQQALEHYQDVTIPNKIEALSLHFNGKLTEVSSREAGEGKYVWITVGDDKVRSSHAVSHGQIFSWNDSPIPGEEYNCRCGAAPVQVAGLGAGIKLLEKIFRGSGNKVKDVAKKVKKKPIKISDKQIQKKYKHAKDFGLPKNYNKQNAEKFKEKIQNHVKDKNTKIIDGIYHGKKVRHHYNDKTGINVIKDADGNFVSGWRLSTKQTDMLQKTGKIGGAKCLY